jgi:uncharacterized Zn finger protein
MTTRLYKLKTVDVKDLCSKQVYKRGLAYFKEGRVTNTQIHDGLTLRGEVQGSELKRYRVRIYCENGRKLTANCTCPFDFEIFCKHSISLLLQWVHNKEEFLNIDSVMANLRTKSKKELLTLIEDSITSNSNIFIDNISNLDNKRFKKWLDELFLDRVDYYHVDELIGELDKITDSAEKLFKRNNIQESFNLVKNIVDVCIKNYDVVDDSDGMLAKFIEECLNLYARIIQLLNVDWTVKKKIHEDNWKIFVMDKYDLSDSISKMIVDSCMTENDFIFIEKLASDELRIRKTKGHDYQISEIVDLLLDIYEKNKDDKKFLLLCEKEFKYSYFRYMENLESKGRISEAVECCKTALGFEKGLLRIQLIEKLGDLIYTQGNIEESLRLYINAYKEKSEEDGLLDKINHVSKELGRWKKVKDELTFFMNQKGDNHQLVEIYLRDNDLDSAFKIVSQEDASNLYDVERVAKGCEKSMPHEAAELYRKLGEEFIKQSDRNGYRLGKYDYKNMKRLYEAMGKAEEFKIYINAVRFANRKKRALQEELSEL